jgi:radical SAM protein with 4Fe4S-binding SPASM domain
MNKKPKIENKEQGTKNTFIQHPESSIQKPASISAYITKRDLNKESLWSKGGPRLPHLDIELTERCNNNCIHCCINLPENDKKAKARELKTEEWKDVIKQAADLGTLTVRFTGGEPLLRGDFQDLYMFTRKLGIKVLLFTNARLITPELADLFAKIPPLEKIEITVYGMHEKSYEAVSCAKGSYDQFRKGVDLFLKRKVPFVVKSALLPPNKDEIEEFEAWSKTIPWMDKSPSYSMFFELRGRRDSATKNRKIAKLRLSPEQGLQILTKNKERFLNEMYQFCNKFMGPPGDKLFSCGAGHGACVDAYGRFQVCMPLRYPSLSYDLKIGSLKDAIQTAFPKVLDLRAENPDYLARCARCFLKGLCEQCPGKSWSEHGTLDTPIEYLCEVAHEQARYLWLLNEGEKAWEVKDWKERIKKMRS